VRLLIKGYLKEEYQQTSYSTNVYVVPGTLAPRFIHLTHEAVLQAVATPLVEITLAKQTPKKRGRRTKNTDQEGGEEVFDENTPPTKKQKTAAARGKGKEIAETMIVGIDFDDGHNLDHMYVDNPRPKGSQSSRALQKKKGNVHRDENDEYETINADVIEDVSDGDSDDVTYDWSKSLREEPRARRKKAGRGAQGLVPDDDILVLSD
jgi:ATP-dependent DNA helicase Q1